MRASLEFRFTASRETPRERRLAEQLRTGRCLSELEWCRDPLRNPTRMVQKRHATPARTGQTPSTLPPSNASIARASPNTLRSLPIGTRKPPPK